MFEIHYTDCPEPPIDPPDLEDPAGTYYYGVWIPDEQEWEAD